MRRIVIKTALILALCGCNSVYMKPGTLDKDDIIYAERGGKQLLHVTKIKLDERGYTVTVGHKRKTASTTYIEESGDDSIISESDTGRANYIVQIAESKTTFSPLWCMFNGFWWWGFDMSIADNKTGQEILNWAGRGCAHSTIRKLEQILDELEVKHAE